MIHRNPRGVRKIDLQKERRHARYEARKLYNEQFYGNDVAWKLRNAYEMGWEQGAKDAHAAGLARIDEALEKGTLIKP